MTTFPEEVQTFIEAMDVTAEDGALIKRYQDARNNGDIALANQILQQIPYAANKLVNADKLQTIFDTCAAVEDFFLRKFSPAYVVSDEQPAYQDKDDFWFEILG